MRASHHRDPVVGAEDGTLLGPNLIQVPHVKPIPDSAKPAHAVLNLDVLHLIMEYLSHGCYHGLRTLNRRWNQSVVPRLVIRTTPLQNANDVKKFSLFVDKINYQPQYQVLTLSGYVSRYPFSTSDADRLRLDEHQISPNLVRAICNTFPSHDELSRVIGFQLGLGRNTATTKDFIDLFRLFPPRFIKDDRNFFLEELYFGAETEEDDDSSHDGTRGARKGSDLSGGALAPPRSTAAAAISHSSNSRRLSSTSSSEEEEWETDEDDEEDFSSSSLSDMNSQDRAREKEQEELEHLLENVEEFVLGEHGNRDVIRELNDLYFPRLKALHIEEHNDDNGRYVSGTMVGYDSDLEEPFSDDDDDEEEEAEEILDFPHLVELSLGLNSTMKDWKHLRLDCFNTPNVRSVCLPHFLIKPPFAAPSSTPPVDIATSLSGAFPQLSALSVDKAPLNDTDLLNVLMLSVGPDTPTPTCDRLTYLRWRHFDRGETTSRITLKPLLDAARQQQQQQRKLRDDSAPTAVAKTKLLAKKKKDVSHGPSLVSHLTHLSLGAARNPSVDEEALEAIVSGECFPKLKSFQLHLENRTFPPPPDSGKIFSNSKVVWDRSRPAVNNDETKIQALPFSSGW